MSFINAISAVGNNNSVYPFIVRDCAIEAPAKITQTYTQSAKDSKKMAFYAAREKVFDEYGTSLVWMWGVPVTEWACNKLIKYTTGLNGDVNLKLLEKDSNGNYKNKSQNIDLNIKKFKDKAPEAVKDLELIKNNAAKYKTISNNKYAFSLITPMVVMGLVLPKLIYASTNYFIDRDLKKQAKIKERAAIDKMQTNRNEIKYNIQNTINNDNNFKSLNTIKINKNNDNNNNKQNNINFKGFASKIASMSQPDKMAATDIGLTAGRVVTARSRNEGIEKLFFYSGMLLLNFVTPKIIDKGLDFAIKKTFGLNTALDPKIMADKRFLVKIKNDSLKLPKKEEDVIDFIDNNPKSILVKYAKKDKLVKFLDNDIRDPRAFVDTKEVFKLSEQMREFAEQAPKTKEKLNQYAKVAMRAKSCNIISNIAISSALLAIALPQAQFLLRKFISDSNVEPGIITSNNNEKNKLNKTA